MSDREIVVHLFYQNGGSYKAIAEESVTASDLGGVPEPGDCIVSQGVLQGRDRNDPANREVYEVVRRYFFGDGARDERAVHVHLLVNVRPGQLEEINILGE